MRAADLPIKTERLLLRNFHVDDYKAVHQYACDPEVVYYLPWGPNNERDTQEFINRAIANVYLEPRTDFELAVILSEQSRLVGAAGIHISDLLNREGWIGYCFNKQIWGNSIATEAATALLSFGFFRLGLHRIFATVDPANSSSINVLRKIGMTQEGHFRSHKLVRGNWRDTDRYGIIESEWTKG